jgi:hypothetical protein
MRIAIVPGPWFNTLTMQPCRPRPARHCQDIAMSGRSLTGAGGGTRTRVCCLEGSHAHHYITPTYVQIARFPFVSPPPDLNQRPLSPSSNRPRPPRRRHPATLPFGSAPSRNVFAAWRPHGDSNPDICLDKTACTIPYTMRPGAFPARLERAASRFAAWCSLQLSYGNIRFQPWACYSP